MMHRVEVNVIKMAIQIVLIPDNVVPEPVLPYTTGTVAITIAAGIRDLESVHDLRNGFILDINNHVKMIRHDYPRTRFSLVPAIEEETGILQQYLISLECDGRDEIRSVPEFESA